MEEVVNILDPDVLNNDATNTDITHPYSTTTSSEFETKSMPKFIPDTTAAANSDSVEMLSEGEKPSQSISKDGLNKENSSLMFLADNTDQAIVPVISEAPSSSLMKLVDIDLDSNSSSFVSDDTDDIILAQKYSINSRRNSSTSQSKDGVNRREVNLSKRYILQRLNEVESQLFETQEENDALKRKIEQDRAKTASLEDRFDKLEKHFKKVSRYMVKVMDTNEALQDENVTLIAKLEEFLKKDTEAAAGGGVTKYISTFWSSPSKESNVGSKSAFENCSEKVDELELDVINLQEEMTEIQSFVELTNNNNIKIQKHISELRKRVFPKKQAAAAEENLQTSSVVEMSDPESQGSNEFETVPLD